MDDKKDLGRAVRISTEDYDILVKLAESLGKSMKILLGTLIGMNKRWDLFTPGWEKRVTEAFNRADLTLELSEFEGLDEAPRAMKWSEKRFVYVEKTQAGTMKVTKLSPICKEALAVCNEFELQVKETIEREMLQSIIEEKDEKISALTIGDFQTVKIPVCNMGARIKRHGNNFMGCPSTAHNREVSIKNWCKVKLSNGPCMSLAFIELYKDSYKIVNMTVKEDDRSLEKYR